MRLEPCKCMGLFSRFKRPRQSFLLLVVIRLCYGSDVSQRKKIDALLRIKDKESIPEELKEAENEWVRKEEIIRKENLQPNKVTDSDTLKDSIGTLYIASIIIISVCLVSIGNIIFCKLVYDKMKETENIEERSRSTSKIYINQFQQNSSQNRSSQIKGRDQFNNSASIHLPPTKPASACVRYVLPQPLSNSTQPSPPVLPPVAQLSNIKNVIPHLISTPPPVSKPLPPPPRGFRYVLPPPYPNTAPPLSPVLITSKSQNSPLQPHPNPTPQEPPVPLSSGSRNNLPQPHKTPSNSSNVLSQQHLVLNPIPPPPQITPLSQSNPSKSDHISSSPQNSIQSIEAGVKLTASQEFEPQSNSLSDFLQTIKSSVESKPTKVPVDHGTPSQAVLMPTFKKVKHRNLPNPPAQKKTFSNILQGVRLKRITLRKFQVGKIFDQQEKNDTSKIKRRLCSSAPSCPVSQPTDSGKVLPQQDISSISPPHTVTSPSRKSLTGDISRSQSPKPSLSQNVLPQDISSSFAPTTSFEPPTVSLLTLIQNSLAQQSGYSTSPDPTPPHSRKGLPQMDINSTTPLPPVLTPSRTRNVLPQQNPPKQHPNSVPAPSPVPAPVLTSSGTRNVLPQPLLNSTQPPSPVPKPVLKPIRQPSRTRIISSQTHWILKPQLPSAPTLVHPSSRTRYVLPPTSPVPTQSHRQNVLPQTHLDLIKPNTPVPTPETGNDLPQPNGNPKSPKTRKVLLQPHTNPSPPRSPVPTQSHRQNILPETHLDLIPPKILVPSPDTENDLPQPNGNPKSPKPRKVLLQPNTNLFPPTSPVPSQSHRQNVLPQLHPNPAPPTPLSLTSSVTRNVLPQTPTPSTSPVSTSSDTRNVLPQTPTPPTSPVSTTSDTRNILPQTPTPSTSPVPTSPHTRHVLSQPHRKPTPPLPTVQTSPDTLLSPIPPTSPVLASSNTRNVLLQSHSNATQSSSSVPTSPHSPNVLQEPYLSATPSTSPVQTPSGTRKVFPQPHPVPTPPHTVTSPSRKSLTGDISRSLSPKPSHTLKALSQDISSPITPLPFSATVLPTLCSKSVSESESSTTNTDSESYTATESTTESSTSTASSPISSTITSSITLTPLDCAPPTDMKSYMKSRSCSANTEFKIEKNHSRRKTSEKKSKKTQASVKTA